MQAKKKPACRRALDRLAADHDTNNTALVHLSKGIPVTDSLAIAREFGRSHKHVLRTLDDLIADGTIDRPNFGPISYTDDMNRQQRMIELDERGALVAMPFIGGRKSRQGQARLVDAFLTLRDASLKTAKAQTKIESAAARQEAATGYRTVSMTLEMCRTEGGKATKPYHYANEARLLNFALTGKYDALARDTLSTHDLRILTSLEVRDAALIAMGKSYAERKADLVQYASAQRLPRLRATMRRAATVREVANHAR